ncbi:MAG: GIY-YIG nuclease family protein [Verrucomicrobia bacterium]|nr:GIY-YIG nuclease family protein [Verrucomicrobiota bacterium]
MLYRVYLLRNSSGLRYIGISEDVLRRLSDHNAGKSQWTKSRRPWELIWQSRPLCLSDARKLENLLKRQKGGDGLESLLTFWADSGS